MPVNLATICEYFGKSMSPDTCPRGRAEPVEIDSADAQNLGEGHQPWSAARSTRRSSRRLHPQAVADGPQGARPGDLQPASVRYNFDNRYFNDKYEGLPVDGYTAWLERMVDHPNIEVRLNTDFFDVRDEYVGNVPIVYTGPIDAYFQ